MGNERSVKVYLEKNIKLGLGQDPSEEEVFLLLSLVDDTMTGKIGIRLFI